MSKPVIVIVPGAWHKPVVWHDVVQQLHTAGFEAIHVELRTVGSTTTPLHGLTDDVTAVQSVLGELAGQGKKALVLGHSAGGLIGSNATKGQDNVIGMIYMAAFVIPRGKALLDLLGGKPLPWMEYKASRSAIGDRVFGRQEMLADVMFNDLNAEEQKKWMTEMTHTSAALFATPSGSEPWKNGIPCAYIFCTEDNALPFVVQQEMAAQLGPEAKAATLESGHCPFLSIPEQLVDAIQMLEAQMRATYS
ncbi:alpha/beta-hydrolase [Neurospora tetrasperma FGSC 2509]|nr:alpha/beta-hydrolase [Neurospora tetrasperma FGSC 2509]